MTEQTPSDTAETAAEQSADGAGRGRRKDREGKDARARKQRPDKPRADKPRAEKVRPDKPRPDRAARLAARAAREGAAADGDIPADPGRDMVPVAEAVGPDENGRRREAGIGESQVRLGYRLILNRVPSAAEVAEMMSRAPSLPDLRMAFLNSDEFDQKYARLKAERTAQRPPVLVHLHIPKTAGTTLAEAFAREPNMQPQAVIHDQTLHELREMPAHQRRALRYIRGHLNMGTGEVLGVPYRYLSTIRRPGPRIYSFFRFIQRHRPHPSHAEVAGMSFGDYLEYSQVHTPHRIEIDNGQIRRLSGQLGVRQFGREQAWLPLALHHVLNPATIFGYVEHFDALVRRLVAEGYLSSADIPASNVAPKGTGDYDAAVAALSQGQRALFEAYTVWDNYFYDLCLTLLPPDVMPESVPDGSPA